MWNKAKHTSFPSNTSLSEKQNKDLIRQFLNDQPKPEDHNYDAKQFALACSEYWKNMANIVVSMKIQGETSSNTESSSIQNNEKTAKNLGIGSRGSDNEAVSPRVSGHQKINLLHSSAPNLPLSPNNSISNNNDNETNRKTTNGVLNSENRMAFRKTSAQRDGYIPPNRKSHSKGISLGVNKVSLGVPFS